MQQILSRFGAADADTLDLAGFLAYWKSRMDSSSTHFLRDEIRRLCARAKVEVGAESRASSQQLTMDQLIADWGARAAVGSKRKSLPVDWSTIMMRHF